MSTRKYRQKESSKQIDRLRKKEHWLKEKLLRVHEQLEEQRAKSRTRQTRLTTNSLIHDYCYAIQSSSQWLGVANRCLCKLVDYVQKNSMSEESFEYDFVKTLEQMTKCIELAKSYSTVIGVKNKVGR